MSLLIRACHNSGCLIFFCLWLLQAFPGCCFCGWLHQSCCLIVSHPCQTLLPRVFKALLYVPEGSFAEGKTLTEVRAKTENRIKIERIQRGENLFLARLPSVKLQAGDRLYVRDTAERLKEFEKLLGAALYNVSDTETETPVSDDVPLATEGQQLAEVVITRGSPLHHRTLGTSQFGVRYNLTPLALHRSRPGKDVVGDLDSTRLRAGDVLLVQGSRAAIVELRAGGTMLVLDGTTDLPHTDRANVALGIMLRYRSHQQPGHRRFLLPLLPVLPQCCPPVVCAGVMPVRQSIFRLS